MLSEITDATFPNFLNTSITPVLVDVWATWCVPCKVLLPQLERVATEHASNLVVVKLDADANRMFCERFKVASIPTLLLFVGGTEVARQVGAAGGYAAIKTLVAPHL